MSTEPNPALPEDRAPESPAPAPEAHPAPDAAAPSDTPPQTETAAQSDAMPINAADVDQQIAAELAAVDADALMEASVAPQTAEPSATEDALANEPAEPRHHELRRGRVAAIRGEDVFVDLVGDFDGKKLQGVVPVAQFERPPRLKAIMDFVVDTVDEAKGLVFLSREGAISRSTWDQLTTGSVIEARVTGHNKGGLELEIVGGIKAFMPASQVDLHSVGELEPFVGQKLDAAVQEIDRKHKKVLLSRRKYLEIKRGREKRKTLAELEVGQDREGVITNVMAFGAFVDIGGIDGLVHVTDLAHGHVDKPSDIVSVGDKVRVRVMKIEPDKERISLGMKQVMPDPWEQVPAKYQTGEEVSVRVTKTANFGAFVELEPGVEALLPMSEMSWNRIHRAEDVVKAGDVIKVQVLKIEPGKHRMSVSLKAAAGDPWSDASGQFTADQKVEGKVTSTTDFGAFVEIAPGVEGMVHISELSDRRVGQVTDIVKVGDTKTFRIKSIDPDNRKISLSLKEPGQGGGRGPREDQYVPQPAKPKIPKDQLKSGLGKSGALGTGLGGLKLEDFK
ncbi:MAG: S1 RNA-binding domain-containing protein [Planctomycetota bacterium]